MHFLIEKFEKLVKGFNKKPLTEKDLLKICKKEGICIVEEDSDDMEWPAFYMMLDDIPTLFINAKIGGLERLWGIAHEIGHYFLHSPATCFFSDHAQSKPESEANLFAAYALFPETTVKQIPLWEIYDVDPCAVKLFHIRLGFFDSYKR